MMRSPTISTLLFLLHFQLVTLSTAVSLADFQPINGFTSSCTKAYSTPLQDCTAGDFGNGASCSSKCIAFLEALTDVLNQQCKGTAALPTTLMGLFYINRGTSSLCPNVIGTSSDTSDSVVQQEQITTITLATSQAPTSTSSKTRQNAQTSSSSSSITSSSTSTSTSQTSSSSASSTSTSSKSTSQTKATTTSSSTTSSKTNTSRSSSSSGSQTSTAPAGAETSPSNSNNRGGGTILDIGSSAPPNRRIHGLAALVWLSCILVASVRILR